MTFAYHCYVDWNDDGVYEADESAYLDSIQIQRGRRDIFTQPYVGKMTVRLKNHTGRFTPWNAGSLIYPNVAPGRRVQMVVDVPGTTDEATTNSVTNPSFEVNVTDGWSVSGGTPSVIRDSTHVKFGNYAAKFVSANPGSYSRFICAQSSASLTTTLTASLFVYSEAPQTAAFRIATIPVDQSWQNLVAGWQRVVWSFSLSSQSDMFFLDLKDGNTVWIDGVQRETKDHATPYCDGSLGLGYSWLGTSHNSASLRILNTTAGYPIFTGRLEAPKTYTQKLGATPDAMLLTAQDGWSWLNQQSTNIALKTNRATGDAIYDVLAAVGWIAGGVWILGTSLLDTETILGGAGIGENVLLDTGSDTIPYWWTADESAIQSIVDLVRSEFGRVQINGDGMFLFKARQADFQGAVEVQLTDSNVQEVSVDTPYEWVKNKVSVRVTPRTLAGLAEVWYLRDTPYILVGDSLTLWAEFTDSTGARAAVSGGVNPVATTDYTANTAANGTGTDKTANVTVTPTFYSTAAKLVITHNAGVTIYITFLHVRGQIVQAMDSQLMVADYAADQALHGVLAQTVDLPWQQNTLTAMDFANWQLGFLKTPQVAPRVVMRGQSLPFMWELGTKVQWNSTKLGFNKTFRVGEFTCDLRKGQQVQATWLLLPTGNENFWILGTSLLDTQTVLGY